MKNTIYYLFIITFVFSNALKVSIMKESRVGHDIHITLWMVMLMIQMSSDRCCAGGCVTVMRIHNVTAVVQL